MSYFKNTYYIIFILSLSVSSCKNKKQQKPVEAISISNKKVENKKTDTLLNNIEKTFPICQDCIYNFDSGDLEFLFSVFDKDLSTDAFSNLLIKSSLAFSLCKDKRDKGYLDCFYLFELNTKDHVNINELYELFERIPETTIHYKPPSNWSWHKKENTIYFLYSGYYEPHSDGFKKLDEILKNSI